MCVKKPPWSLLQEHVCFREPCLYMHIYVHIYVLCIVFNHTEGDQCLYMQYPLISSNPIHGPCSSTYGTTSTLRVFRIQCSVAGPIFWTIYGSINDVVIVAILFWHLGFDVVLWNVLNNSYFDF